MTFDEIRKEYEDFFTLIVENVGELTNNRIYKDVENILTSNNSKELLETVSDCDDLRPYITVLIYLIVSKITKDSTRITDLINDFWDRYLKIPTRRFTGKYGIPNIDTLDTTVIVK